MEKLKVFFAFLPSFIPEYLVINALSEKEAREMADNYKGYNYPIFRNPQRGSCKCIGYSLENSTPGVITDCYGD